MFFMVDVKTKDNSKKKKKYRFLHYLCAAGFLASGAYALSNFWEMHKFDKYVIKQVEIAANVPSAGMKKGKENNTLSMEAALIEARNHTNVSRLENPAIIWKTPISSVDMLEELLDKSIARSKEIEQFKESFDTGEVNEDSPEWIKNAYDKINAGKLDRRLEEVNKFVEQYGHSDHELIKTLLGTAQDLLKTAEEISNSEYGLRMANEYEAVNKVISGGTRLSAKNLSEKHRSLLQTLEKAGGWRSIIRFQADDFKQSHAQVFVGYLFANMGDLDRGLQHFNEAKKLMDKYPDDKNLAIIRMTPELSQKTIKGLIDSSIKELEALNHDQSKYSAGWWKRLTYYNQSIGGQVNPSIMDLSEIINGRYYSRAFWSGILALSLLYFSGRFGKKYKLSEKYEVVTK